MRIPKSELKPGVSYIAFSPEGKRIVGTYDRIPGTALADTFYVEGGKVIPEYKGETDVWWDGQEVVEDDGEALYICENYETWGESQLLFEEEPE